MINSIVFSKDRAMQLRLLLESMRKNADGVFNINVLYHSTSDEFEEGYQRLMEEDIATGVSWHKQGDNFKEDTMSLLKTDSGYSCFFTDDDIIYRTVNVEEIVKALDDQDVFCFSLRLGENTTFCYMMNCSNTLYGQIEDGNVIKFDWQKHYMDFGYPLSVDGHIFRSKEILKLTKKVAFVNPNTYEAALQIFENFPRHLMASYKQSALVNTPMNIVQSTFLDNRSSGQEGLSAESLNQSYLDGNVIDFGSMDFSDIKGCHQEIDLVLKEQSPLKKLNK